MVRLVAIIVAVAIISSVLCKPLEEAKDLDQKVHLLWKRFINTALTKGSFFEDNSLSKLRTKRNAEDCEKLELCRLHARSSSNFFAAYELYFVSKENAKLWDHRAHTQADCDRRFAHCFGRASAPAQPKQNYREYRNDDYDYYY